LKSILQLEDLWGDSAFAIVFLLAKNRCEKYGKAHGEDQAL
jgi:hypothetical protein